ncbi:RNA-directed DNA polymerase, LTR Retrotransposon [Trachipleistophora hominis]|uniref:RNA-directed DNA polymerase, LTR Retrotransposon n=1 Tax=Trachipleistophora hominis TaxID=72359 RepID=L7JU41_TRAHO|nr:RNA-directed DNA polymerase, LTR Retrotransposon [Trachipleistophora hominis]
MELKQQRSKNNCITKESNNNGYIGEECKINTQEGKMVKARPYNNTGPLKEKVEEEIQNMLKKGYIRPSDPEWCNPVRPVEKKNGTIRLCLNLMALNELVEKEVERMPEVDQVLEKLQGAKYFSVLDIKEGYFQINVREEDKKKTAFQIGSRKYEFNRMPMGFKNAPLIFQRIMNRN